ncbi:Uncharacterized protein Fot_49574 [Forsythia ovata]|uniref:Uncharacterized protein n=1 Tax=Forsythia ovata TaxID=205694 RepID=A0ABD1QCA0_9LAMI
MAHPRGHGPHMGSYMGELDQMSRTQQLRNIEHIQSKTWRINFGGYENDYHDHYEYGLPEAHKGHSPWPPPPCTHVGARPSQHMLLEPTPRLDIPPLDRHHGFPRPPSPPCLHPSSHHHGLPEPTPQLGLPPQDHHYGPRGPPPRPYFSRLDYHHGPLGPPRAPHHYPHANYYGSFNDEDPNGCTTM